MKKLSTKKPKAIWLFAGGAMQRPAAEKIRERGYALILTDGSAECVLRSMADEFIHLDTFVTHTDAEHTRHHIAVVINRTRRRTAIGHRAWWERD